VPSVTAIASRHSLRGLGDIGSQCDPGQSRQRLRRDRGIPDATTDLEGPFVQRERATVVARPEDQQPRLEQGSTAIHVFATRHREDTLEPRCTFIEALRGHPEDIEC